MIKKVILTLLAVILTLSLVTIIAGKPGRLINNLKNNDTITDTKTDTNSESQNKEPDSDTPAVSDKVSDSRSPAVTTKAAYSVNITEDITYAEGLVHSNNGSKTETDLKLDLYVPDNESDNRPVYVFVHGGGFQGGTKTKPEIVDRANYFTSRGWVFASVDYRTAEDLTGDDFTGIAPQEWIDYTLKNAESAKEAKTSIAMYAAQRDAKAAVRWIVANADQHGINTDYITIGGASAGAITAITLGVSNQEDFRDEMLATDDPTLTTINLEEEYNIRSIVDLWGSNVKLDLYNSVYNLDRYDSADPELLILHGTEDPTVLFSEAEELVQIYNSTGAHVELVTLEGEGHGAWDAEVSGKSLTEIAFDFLVKRQKLNVE